MNTPREPYEEDERPEGGPVRSILDSTDRVEVQTGYPGDQAPERPAPHTGEPGYAEHPATTVPDDAAREGGAGRVGLLNDVASLRDEWQRVQGTFVDDPQRAVHEASVLVDRTLDEIRSNVGSERPSETMSTEDLRVSFQRYREFFQRLLSA
ncbi:MAG: hypothetical protein ACRDTD_33185 [Pseudonocardiaceae bacterium]